MQQKILEFVLIYHGIFTLEKVGLKLLWKIAMENYRRKLLTKITVKNYCRKLAQKISAEN
jgi:hypothetical protein